MRRLLLALLIAATAAFSTVGASPQSVAAFHIDATHCYWVDNGPRSMWFRCPADLSNPWQKVQTRLHCSNGSTAIGNIITDYGDGLWRTSVATCPVGTVKQTYYLGVWYW